MEKTLGFDLGSNSLGWSIRDTSENEFQFKRTGVITFNKGVGSKKGVEFSFAAERTTHRSIRRLYQARKYKLWATLELLKKKDYCPIQTESLHNWKHYNKENALNGKGGRKYPVDDTFFENWIKLDFNNDGKPDYKSPYQLRLELITKKLDFSISENRYKLGRALYHISQHRGFKSSKKVQNNDIELNPDDLIGAEKKRSKVIGDLLEKHQVTTVGAAFAFEENIGNRIRNELHKDVLRKQLQDEVKQIFEFQNLSFTEIFSQIEKPLTINQSAIFWQRPLRSQKGTIGKCTLEPNKYRCPISHPLFEEFRALSFLNNIQYRIKGITNTEWIVLSPEYREGIYLNKFFRVSKAHFDFYEISKWIETKNGHNNWEFNYNLKTNVAACPVTARLKDIFGENLKDLKIQHIAHQKRKKKKNYYDIDDIWHVLFTCDDEDFIENFALQSLKLDPQQSRKFINLWHIMPVDYGMLSMKAIESILPFLRRGHIYTEATLLAKVPEVLGQKIWLENENLLIGSISQVIEENRSEKKLLTVANNLISNYKSNSEDGKYAYKDFNYQIDDYEKKQINEACIESFGAKSWLEKTEAERTQIENKVSIEYQDFFHDKKREYKKLPHLLNSMKLFLKDNFDFLQCENPEIANCKCKACNKLNKLYHPSQIDIYPPAKERYYEDVEKYLTLLNSPKTGAFKNPMAMRALYELKNLTNYLIKSGQIDENTRIVVELARELNDSNKRWAYETYQRRREEENKEFAIAILELVKDPEVQGIRANPDSEDDIDRFRLWYEMIDGQESIEGFENKEKRFFENTKIIKSKKTRLAHDEEYEEFTENHFERVNKSLYFKLKKSKDDVIAKYRLWKEQNCQCMYTGNMIRITDLFKENSIDFEHTIPRSISFDNSLANLTVCDATYNRNIKTNQIPTELPNYNQTFRKYSAIKPRLQKWEQKVNDLELHIEFWRSKAKRATTKIDKDIAIRQRHLWQFELDYWKDKLYRFTLTEIKSNFKRSQLVDTQIISKYAFHYLKTVFYKVEVQKGSVTAEFRKIFGIQNIDEIKDRSKHSHHAKDAVILTLIPSSALRDQILKLWYEIKEKSILLYSDSPNNRHDLKAEIDFLNEKLNRAINECKIPNVNAVINKIDEQIFINNINKDQALTIGNKRIRRRGKIVGVKDIENRTIYKKDSNSSLIIRKDNKGNCIFKTNERGEFLLDVSGSKIPVYMPVEKWAKGDSIRGQLHLDSFYGKIKVVQRNHDKTLQKNADGTWKYIDKNEGFGYVKKEMVNKDFNIDSIVDPYLKTLFINQMNGRNIDKTLKEDGGIWMLNNKKEKVHIIRHVRCFASDVTEPLAVKKQTYLSSKDYKNSYWAKNGENYAYALYQSTILGKVMRGFQLINLFDASKLKTHNEKRVLELEKEIEIKNGNKLQFYSLLKRGQKVIFFKDGNQEELLDMEISELSKRLYYIVKFEKDGRIVFGYHLDSRSDSELKLLESKYGKSIFNGFSVINYDNPWPRLKLSLGNLDFLIEGQHFIINPDGKIKWLFK